MWQHSPPYLVKGLILESLPTLSCLLSACGIEVSVDLTLHAALLIGICLTTGKRFIF